ncbi:MAG: hydrogenase maturation nickel metallochaperone HypA [Proteobacteria bacterium]|nr:hydrogenase maturation nickel metallochaperone HypA [Pseudomonadota bacterium]
MHEMALAEGVLQLIEDAAQREHFVRVKTIWLEIGQLASVEPEALAFCFDAVTRGSIAEGARLEFVAVAGSGWCMQCEAGVPMAELYAACPRCGGYQLQVAGGTEMRVKELEVEE